MKNHIFPAFLLLAAVMTAAIGCGDSDTGPVDGTAVMTGTTDTTAVTETENTMPADLLLSHLNLPDLTAEYQVRWEKGTTYLVIRAAGNLAGFFINGKMVNDAYLYNQEGVLGTFVVDVRPYDVTEGVLKIQPYTDANEGTICFDAPMPKGKISPQVFTASENVLHI